MFGGVCVDPVAVGDFVTEIRAYLLEGGEKQLGTQTGRSPGGGCSGRFEVASGRLQHLSKDRRIRNVGRRSDCGSQGIPGIRFRGVQRLVERGWIKQFESYPELRAFLGEEMVLSRFGNVTKIRGGKVKKRLSLDAKVSGLERVILHRLLDTARNTLEMLAQCREAELCLLDFADVFWLLPLAPDERKWFTSELCGKY